jgi:hypothetical protein
VKQFAVLTGGFSRTRAEPSELASDKVSRRRPRTSKAFFVSKMCLTSGPAPEILRAMHNLTLALSVRLSKGPLTGVRISAITARLDRAASEIERH